MKLEVTEAELGVTAMGLRFRVLAGAETEEEGDIDEISCALIFGGGRNRGANVDDEAKGGYIFLFGWMVGVGVIPERVRLDLIAAA